MSYTVVGAGVSGLSIAFHLLERGLGPVMVIDRTGVAAGASGVQPGGVRQQWSTRASCLMARESHAFYVDLSRQLGVAVAAQFDPCGYLFLADTAETRGRLAANVAVQQEAGVPSRLLTQAESLEVVPNLRGDEFAGAAFCGEDGYFDRPQAVVEAFADAARTRGAGLEQADVTRIRRDGAGWRLDTTTGWSTSDVLIVAAGGDSLPLLAPLGFDLPLVSEARHLFLSEPLAPGLLDTLVIAVDRGLAAKQLADGRLLASDLTASGDPEVGQARWRARIAEQLASLLPALNVPLPTMRSGVYDLTPDAQPVIDQLDDGLWVAAGFSGHGFMIAPSTGRLVAGTLAGDPPPEWREAVTWERFAGREGERESQVI
jgi:sarcosine oxidase, subunit beta